MISGMVIRGSAEGKILHTTPKHFYESIICQEIQTVLRKGKYILLPLTNDSVIVFHLGMTGKLLLRPVPEVMFEERFEGNTHVDKHTHVILELADVSGDVGPDLELCFNDVRKFGNIWLANNVDSIDRLNVPGLKDLGTDALGITFSEFEAITKTDRAIKAVLLDQTKLAGVGNIYADEACFVARVHPATRARDLIGDPRARLWFAVKAVLKEGIRYRGSSVSDYTTADGSLGSYQEHHRVYGKFGQECVVCGTKIERIKVAGRSTHFCPQCQPRRKS
jgi:formamidopyrimidine-DNA glycosylase